MILLKVRFFSQLELGYIGKKKKKKKRKEKEKEYKKGRRIKKPATILLCVIYSGSL